MARSSDTTPLEFLRTIYATEPKGLVELRAIPLKGSQRGPTRVWTKSPKEIGAFTERFGKRGSEYGVYFGVCKRVREGGKKQDILGTTCLWADIDCVTNGQKIEVILDLIGQMPDSIQPSIVVNSGGGLHCYWLLEVPYQFGMSPLHEEWDYIESANRAVGELVGGDSVHDVTRVMRLPGTFNNKRSPAKGCKVVYCAHHIRFDLHTLLDRILKWGKVIDGDKWSPRKQVADREFRTRPTTEAEVMSKFSSALRGKSQMVLDKLWRDRVRYHAPRGYMGIHEAIVVSTARLHCGGGYTPEQIVEKVVGYIKDVPDIDVTDWDWDAERRKVRTTLESWAPKWRQMQADERKRKKS